MTRLIDVIHEGQTLYALDGEEGVVRVMYEDSFHVEFYENIRGYNSYGFCECRHFEPQHAMVFNSKPKLPSLNTKELTLLDKIVETGAHEVYHTTFGYVRVVLVEGEKTISIPTKRGCIDDSTNYRDDGRYDDDATHPTLFLNLKEYKEYVKKI